MRMHIEVVTAQPAEDAVTPFEVADGCGAADTEENTDNLDLFVGVAWSILETTKVLVEIRAICGDVTLHGDSTIRGGVIDGKDHGGGEGLLKFTKEVLDQCLDGE